MMLWIMTIIRIVTNIFLTPTMSHIAVYTIFNLGDHLLVFFSSIIWLGKLRQGA